MSFLIDLQNITKNYFLSGQTTAVLKDVCLQINKGEMLSIMGASGSGKSTLMNIIGFLDKPSAGKYFFDREAMQSLSDDQLSMIRNQKVGFVFQAFFLLPRLTALQNVMLPLHYRNEPQEVAEKKALRALQKMQIENFAHHKPNQLSGGQQQRVAIARALVGDPEIILADEPTGALDSKTSDEVMNVLSDLNQTEGRTIIIITHDADISERCTRQVKLKDGVLQ